MSSISLEKQLVKLRGQCQPHIDKAIAERDQFNITRWAVINNYFADLEVKEIRKAKIRDHNPLTLDAFSHTQPTNRKP